MATPTETNKPECFDTLKLDDAIKDNTKNSNDVTFVPSQEMILWELPVPDTIDEETFGRIERIAFALDHYETPHPKTTSQKKTRAFNKFMTSLRNYIAFITKDSGFAASAEIDFVVSNTRRFFNGKMINCWVSYSKQKNITPLLLNWSSAIGFQSIIPMQY